MQTFLPRLRLPANHFLADPVGARATFGDGPALSGRTFALDPGNLAGTPHSDRATPSVIFGPCLGIATLIGSLAP
jgi:hypothetical protein